LVAVSAWCRRMGRSGSVLNSLDTGHGAGVTPGEDGGQAEPEAVLPRHGASPPSSTCLQTLKPNPALSAKARSHHGPTRRCPAITVGDSSCLVTLWCRWTISRISMTTRSFPLTTIRSPGMARSGRHGRNRRARRNRMRVSVSRRPLRKRLPRAISRSLLRTTPNPRISVGFMDIR
jgi:hypothetical protein